MDDSDKIWKFTQDYAAHNVACLQERWNRAPVDLYRVEAYEVVGGLLARQVTLSNQLAMAPNLWNPHSAPLFLRSMGDCHINLCWILADFEKRGREFVLYGLGQEALMIEKYKSELDMTDDDSQNFVESMESWLSWQRSKALTEISLGNWSGATVRKMAEEVDLISFYDFSYAPFSAAVHATWQHIGKYNLRPCRSALHKYHSIPYIFDAEPNPYFLFLSAKYLTKSLESFDSKFLIESKLVNPMKKFDELIEQISDEFNSQTA